MALLGHRYFTGASEGTSQAWHAFHAKNWPSKSMMMNRLLQVILIYNVLPSVWSAPEVDNRNFACPVFTDDKDDCQQEAIAVACATAQGSSRLPDTYKCYCIHHVARQCASECMNGITFQCQEFCGEYLERECTGKPIGSTGNPVKQSEEGMSTAMIIFLAAMFAAIAGAALLVYFKRTAVTLFSKKVRQWLQSFRKSEQEELYGKPETASPATDHDVEGHHLLEQQNRPMTDHANEGRGVECHLAQENSPMTDHANEGQLPDEDNNL